MIPGICDSTSINNNDNNGSGTDFGDNHVAVVHVSGGGGGNVGGCCRSVQIGFWLSRYMLVLQNGLWAWKVDQFGSGGLMYRHTWWTHGGHPGSVRLGREAP